MQKKAQKVGKCVCVCTREGERERERERERKRKSVRKRERDLHEGVLSLVIRSQHRKTRYSGLELSQVSLRVIRITIRVVRVIRLSRSVV